ncbi:hypothetical protein HY405_02090 [Candidatus Microgenomates bacterium]|nr:hypothetical protein [Candidatus Microgenomates bacterium]
MEAVKDKEHVTSSETTQEEELALQVEVKAGEWQRLNEFSAYQKRTRTGKIVTVHQAIGNRMGQFDLFFYQALKTSPDKATEILEEIKHLQGLQEFLVDCLIWKERGQVQQRTTPSELETLV